MKRLVAITGKIGSGKTTVGRILAQRGYPVLDCDKINADLLKDEDYLEALYEVLPEAFPMGTFDKGTLTEIVFSQEDKRKKLNALSHPIIFERLFSSAERFDGIVFCEVPLLFGSGKEPYFDEIWVVESTDENSLKRVEMRDRRKNGQAKDILRSQQGVFPKGGTITVIKNDGTIEDLEKQIDRLLCEIE